MSLVARPADRDRRIALTAFIGITLLAGSVVPDRTANADDITIVTGLNVTWDRLASPNTSPLFTLSFGNLTPSNEPVMTAFNLGLRLVPRAGATGSLHVLAASNPAVNPLFTTIEPPIVNPQPEGYTSLGILNASLVDVPVSGSAVNAVSLTLTSTDASGTFDIVVDGNTLLTGYNNVDAEEFAFFNANGSNLIVGQITAVPEPSGLGIAALVAAGVSTAARLWKQLSFKPA